MAKDGQTPKDLAIHPNLRQVYVTNSSVRPIQIGQVQNDTISIIPESLASSQAVEVGNHPVGLCIDSTKNRLFVSNRDSQSISVVDLASRKVIDSILLDGAPERIAFAKEEIYLIKEGQVLIVDLRLRKVVKTIREVFDPTDLAVSPDQQYVYVVNSGNNSLSVVETNSRSVITEVKVGNFPIRATVISRFQSESDLILVVNQAESTVSLVEQIGKRWVVAEEEIEVGFNPLGIAATKDKVYVVVQENSVIEVFRF